MTDTSQTQNNGNQNGGQQDGNNNANQGGNNSQGQGGNQNQNQGGDKGNQGANQGGGNGGNQGGAVDYEKKFSESSKEANRLLEVLKANGIDPKTGKKADSGNNGGGNANDGGNGANDLPFFTDADLEAAFPSFGTMSDEEKALLRNVGQFPKMARMVAEMYDKSTFTEQLEVLKADPANKLIADNEKEFKAFAYKDGNLKLPIEILANAFIGQKLRDQQNGGGNNGGGNQNQGGQGNQQRQGMENGSGGQGGNGDAVTEMTADQARDLRKKDPRQYNALARAGKLKIVTE